MTDRYQGQCMTGSCEKRCMTSDCQGRFMLHTYVQLPGRFIHNSFTRRRMTGAARGIAWPAAVMIEAAVVCRVCSASPLSVAALASLANSI
jgi:hypothetical protein